MEATSAVQPAVKRAVQNILASSMRKRRDFWDSIGDAFEDAADDVGSAVTNVASDVGSGIEDTAEDVGSGIEDTVEDVGSGIKDAIGPFIQGFPSDAFQQLDALARSMERRRRRRSFWDSIADVADEVGSGIEDTAEDVGSGIEDAAEAVGSGVTDAAEDVGPAFASLLDTVKTALNEGEINDPTNILHLANTIANSVGRR